MQTAMELGLEYDNSYTPTENLFLQLFGSLPNVDCESESVQKILISLVNSVEFGQAVRAFFGLGTRRISADDKNASESFLGNVNAGLNEIKELFSDEIVVLYKTFARRRDISTEEYLVQQLVEVKTKYRALQKDYRAKVETDRLRAEMASRM